ncbi:acyl carrier protein [Camelimonas abortus]|uniref:Acyl carrier protein n=1 Tax=Camelimonas abortus TaxID=1017184 RepID=A0ABV7LAU7_9HYPH
MTPEVSPQTLETLRDIVAGALFLPREHVDLDARFSSIGALDSLTFELITLEIERHSGREIDPVRVMEVETLRDLAALLERADAGQ